MMDPINNIINNSGNEKIIVNENKSNNDDLLQVVNLNEESDSNFQKFKLNNYPRDEISPGKVITLHFSLAPADNPNALIDSNFDKSPVSFEFGDGNILTEFEEIMIGLKAGDKKTFTVDAQKAFGLRNKDNIHCYPRDQLPADLIINKGLMINFSDAGGNEQAGVITNFSDDEVFVDFNHPLANMDILFTVDIKSVEPI